MAKKDRDEDLVETGFKLPADYRDFETTIIVRDPGKQPGGSGAKRGRD
jgi:hypothetical protein